MSGSVPTVVADGARHDQISMDRLVLFSDAVFAIVITLLILPLATEVDPTDADLAGAVAAQWPRIVAFVVSFLVIGQFWVAHHRLFAMVRRGSLLTVWLNLVVLLGVTFIPFPTALLGGYATDRFAGVFYAASLAVVSVLVTVLWTHVRAAGLVVDDPEEIRVFTVRAVITTALFAVAVVVATLLPYAATLAWLASLPVVRAVVTGQIVRRPGRGDVHEGGA